MTNQNLKFENSARRKILTIHLPDIHISNFSSKFLKCSYFTPFNENSKLC